MRGRLRNKNRQQSQREQTFQQGQFDAGWINDLPASDLPKGGMALLENFVGFPEYLEGRSGSQRLSDTALPGSGTVHAYSQHPTNKKWVLHRGGGVYVAGATQSTWTELRYHTMLGLVGGTVAGDTGSQLSVVQLYHTSTSNTNAGTLYWNLTNSGSTRTVNIYMTNGSPKTNLVATGSRVGNGVINLAQQNNSGLGGHVTVAYSGDDTDTGNTITVSTEQPMTQDVVSYLRPVGNDFFLFIRAGVVANHNVYIDLTNSVLIAIALPRQYGYGIDSFTGVASAAAATPYGYRYLYTFSRIVNATTGAPDVSLNRVSGTLKFEGPANTVQNAGGTNAVKDYGEIWRATPITASDPYTLTVTVDGTVTGLQVGYSSSPHITHLSVYRSMDVGAAGVDPVNGVGNNREIYTWVGDFDITATQISDTKSDDDIRAAFGAGFGLKTRFWTELPTGEVGEITNGFIYCGKRGQNIVSYGQINYQQHIGFYNPSLQFFKLDDGLQIIAKSPDMASFICNNKTYVSNPNAYFDAGGGSLAPTYVIQHLTTASENIGVTDVGSFTAMDNAFVAHCSDHTIRIWNSSYWSEDIASRRINQIVRQMVIGSLGIYGAGAYYLFYRTSSSETNNTLCLRYGFSRESGFGWSRVSGSAWPVPPTYAGAAQILDDNNLQRIIVYDAVDAFSYWIETFTAYTGSATTKVFRDKVAVAGTGGTNIVCTARFPEWTADEESLDLFHKESYIYDRPYDEATGYPSGFSRTLRAYVDGSATAASTITAATAKGDLQFFDKVSGNRIQMEVAFATSGARLTGLGTLVDVFDRMAIGSTAANTTDATSQAALASNLTHWLTRPLNLLNRATGTSYTLTGTAPTNVTGPDGRSYGLSFISGASYSIADATNYSNFTVHFWGSTMATASRIFQITGSNNFYVQFGSNTSLSINGAGNITVATVASGWHDFWIVRSGSTVSVYQAGAVLGSTVTVATARGGTTFDINPDGAAMNLYDIRVYSSAKSATEIAYYYTDVSSATLVGNKVLPLA